MANFDEDLLEIEVVRRPLSLLKKPTNLHSLLYGNELDGEQDEKETDVQRLTIYSDAEFDQESALEDLLGDIETPRADGKRYFSNSLTPKSLPPKTRNLSLEMKSERKRINHDLATDPMAEVIQEDEMDKLQFSDDERKGSTQI